VQVFRAAGSKWDKTSDFDDVINSSQHWQATAAKWVNRHFHQPSKQSFECLQS